MAEAQGTGKEFRSLVWFWAAGVLSEDFPIFLFDWTMWSSREQSTRIRTPGSRSVLSELRTGDPTLQF